MEGLTPAHLVLIVVIALLVIGPGKLPETGAAIGKAMREFRHSLNDTAESRPRAPGEPGRSDETPPVPPPG